MWSFERFVEESQRAATVLDLKAAFESALAGEGYENHVMTTTVDGQTIGAIHWFEGPPGYFEAYLAERWERIDPLIGPASRARRPVFWRDVICDRTLTPQQAAFMEHIRQLGVQSGAIFPILGTYGGPTHVNASRRVPGTTDPGRLPVLWAICTQAWHRYLDLNNHAPRGEDRPALTARETEILNWLKDGKSNSEVSEILNVSVKTVEYHVGNILTKLGASNRISAVVVALRMGLLHL